MILSDDEYSIDYTRIKYHIGSKSFWINEINGYGCVECYLEEIPELIKDLQDLYSRKESHSDNLD